jgi:hypothetical protein
MLRGISPLAPRGKSIDRDIHELSRSIRLIFLTASKLCFQETGNHSGNWMSAMPYFQHM